MNKPIRRFITCILLGMTLLAGSVQAASLSEAVDQARRDTGGKVLSARTEVRGDREVHIIKVLTEDGRVRMVRVDGERRGGKDDRRRPR